MIIINKKEIKMFNNKVILITGGTGSFGKKYTQIILEKYKPKKIIIYSRDELKQYEMAHTFPDSQEFPMRYFIVIIRGIFLKGLNFYELFPQTFALFIYGVIIFALAIKKFRKTIE